MTSHWFTEQLRNEPRRLVAFKLRKRIEDDTAHGRYSPDHREMARMNEALLTEHHRPASDDEDNCPACDEVWPCDIVAGILAWE